MAGCGVPANHLPRWVSPHALLARGSVDGAINLCSPSTVAKVNYQLIRYLHFGSVEGDLQEGHFYDSRSPFSVFLSTRSGFLFFFGVWNPRYLAFRAQNRHFCALLPSEPPVFGHFEHKIEVFVLFCPSRPSFSGVSSTKSRFLCDFCLRDRRFQGFRAQKRHFCELFDFGTPIFRLFEHKSCFHGN